GAVPSSYVTAEAFEKISTEICEDVKNKQFEAIYLDLQGAAMAEGIDDAEGELLARVRALVGDAMPIVASLDLHANVTHQMLVCADALLS
ncbi:M81 family metallopeptidase, partial [Paraburkholderia sp. SIMBA_030]|uniref:M81 family metallopeptidase n=1 Tax=Paraburkholderia sp. SIMBA_030 TaxID=3085773 RepID=UPI00397B7950